jgi:hypothetical protein
MSDHIAPTGEPHSDEDSLVHKIAALILAGLTTAVGVLTAIGINEGALLRLYRNVSYWAIVFYVLIVLGVAVEAIAVFFDVGRKWFGFAGVALFLSGLVLAISVGVTSVGIESRPDLNLTYSTADFEETQSIAVALDADNLKASSRVNIVVISGLAKTPASNGNNAKDLVSHLLFRAIVGADEQGKLHRDFKIPINRGVSRRIFALAYSVNDKHGFGAKLTGLFNKAINEATFCQDFSNEVIKDKLSSCLEYVLPTVALQPTFTASWVDAGRSEVVVNVSDEHLKPNSVHVRVRASIDGGNSYKTTLFEGALAPDRAGNLHTSLPLRLPKNATDVCVEAERVLGLIEGARVESAFVATSRCESPKASFERVSWERFMVPNLPDTS